ncbi:hypothetical protein FJT64_022563 [Amphibalanus amphitrite]|uniref:SGNH hydrolase-type esterase domain-containing protein n=1 Tax=Amphibalanus amphitrite TaxID=1232801 RepID=A0A6A4WKY3_AMPAM|nr:hypothetical protein FJT64_022563 [Amphibalanus amphitrite]
MPKSRCKKTWRRLQALEAEVASQAARREAGQRQIRALEAEVASLRAQVSEAPGPSARERPEVSELETRVVRYSAAPEVRSANPGQTCHLLLGDSIARDAGMVVDAPDLLTNMSVGGMTFHRLATGAREKIARWRQHCRAEGLRCGHIVIWCGGNDAYGGRGLATEDVVATVRACGENEVFVLGPTPRIHGRVYDRPDCSWSGTLAFRAESRIASALAGFANVTIVRHLGRQLCSGSQRKLGRRPGVFRSDGVHLSQEGYRRVFARVSGVLAWLHSTV